MPDPDLYYQWIDCLWLPISLFMVQRGRRLMTLAFIIACILTLRTQIELMEGIGHPNGIMGLMPGLGLYERGLIVYGVLAGLFLILAKLSPKTSAMVFLAVIITIYLFAFCGSMLLMLV
ncbi:MAG: hypothetical protein JWO78_2035 [Micavibrio sp.]|nr:hypothetical protein [Micavibrio sp.]